MKIGLYAMSSMRTADAERVAFASPPPIGVGGLRLVGQPPANPSLTALLAMCEPGDELVCREVAPDEVAPLDDTLDLVVISTPTPRALDAYRLADRFRAIGKQVVVESPRVHGGTDGTAAQPCGSADDEQCMRLMLCTAG